jgi:Fe-Mn family superoxide dismutase
MKFELPALPYESGALEPVIGKQTVELHHGKHFQAYITNLNNLIAGTKYESMELVDIVKDSDGPIFNNAGQALNHTIYFSSFSPKGGGAPSGKLADAISAQYGDFENFKKEFNAAATTVFGSGWAWLSKDANGKLVISKEANGSNPVVNGLTPLLGFDVWEHAYYLDYQNRRPDHVTALWSIIDWKAVESRY